MRGVSTCMLLAIGASLLGGCVSAARDPASSNNRILLQYALGPSGQDMPSIAFLPRDLRLAPSTSMTVIVLDSSNSNNLAFCRALFGRDNSQSSFLPQNRFAQDTRTMMWFENQSSAELQNADTTPAACTDRLDHFHFERARTYQGASELERSTGPWLVSVDSRSRKVVSLDFSGYPVSEYRKELAKWQKNVANNDEFWLQTQSRDFATMFLIMEYVTEFSSGRLKIHIRGEDQSPQLQK